MKPGYKTTEFGALVIGVLGAVVPVILDKVPSESVWATVLGTIAAAISYIGGRTVLKLKDSSGK